MCINCTDNTAGDHCELCQPGYFQDLALLLNDQNICRGKTKSRLGQRVKCLGLMNTSKYLNTASQCKHIYVEVLPATPLNRVAT